MSFLKGLNWSIILPAIIAIASWFFVNWFGAQRDRTNKLRDIKTEYLISAYRNLANSSMRFPGKGSEYFRQMESAIADIQLFGTKSQIEKVHIFLNDFRKNGSASFDPLLNDLRNDLRIELDLEPIDNNVQWFRPEGSPSLENSQLDKK